MKYKTYITTYALFIILYFLSLIIISGTIFNNQLESAKEQAMNEHYFLTSSISRDCKELFNNDDFESSIVYLDYHKKSYLNSNSKFSLSKGNNIIYATNFSVGVNEDFFDITLPDAGFRRISVDNTKDEVYINITGAMPEIQNYYLSYYFDASKYMSAWRQVNSILLFTGIIFSIILGIFLIFLLNKVFKPFEIITAVSKKISKGDYEQKVPNMGKGELSEMALSFNNMTNEIQKQIVLLSQAAEQKQQFIDNFSHELRTPLTSIYGYAEYLKNVDTDNDEKDEAIEFIMNESRSIVNLSNSLLDLATYRTQNLIMEKINMHELLSEIEEVLKIKLEEKQIKFIYIIEFDILYGARDLIKVLIQNLVNNAINISSNGNEVVVEAFLEEDNKVIIVNDWGKGISEEHLENITEPFYRVDKARNRKEGGSGLGLAICKQICSCHNASLLFESTLNKGTKAIIRFTSQQ